MKVLAVGRGAFLFVDSERAGYAAVIHHPLAESCKAEQINPLTHLTHIRGNARNEAARLPTPDALAELTAAQAVRCAL